VTEHVHLTPEIFDAYKRGVISQGQFYRLLGEAVYACDGCCGKLQSWGRGRPYHHRTPARPTLDDVLQLIYRPTREERKAAKRDFARLLRLPKEDRAPKIRRAFKRYRSPVLVELLLEASLERLPVDAEDAHHLADLAQMVLHQCVGSARVNDLRVLCLAHLAIASKAMGDLEVAEQKFRTARHLLEDLPAPHPHVQADLARMEGSYRKDRRQLERSETLLTKAITLYELLDDASRTALSRLVLAGTQFYAGAVDEAVATTNAALTALNSRTYRRLFLMGRYNLTLFLAESGRSKEAAIRLKADLTLYRAASSSWPNVDLHFHWLAGKIQRGLANHGQAEEHLVRARDGFAERGTAYDAILVCLDLGLVLAAERRYEELSELADLMISGLAAQGLHDEAMAAVSLAAEAARERRLTEKVVREVSHFLQFSRHDPALKWEF